MTEKAKPVKAWAVVKDGGAIYPAWTFDHYNHAVDLQTEVEIGYGMKLRIARVETREIEPPPEVHVRQSDKSDRWTVVRSDMGGFVAEFWGMFGATREDAERFAEELRNRLENEDDQG